MLDTLFIRVPIYGMRIWVYRYENEDDFKQLGEFSLKFHKCNLTDTHDFGDGACVPFNGNAIIWFKKDTHEHIAHEIFHACVSMGDVYGFKDIMKDQEPMAYLIGYVTKKIYNSKYKVVG